jgi:hypothetical protein
LILEKGTSGFSVERLEDKMGLRASSTAAIAFDQARVPRANLLGKPGEGLKILLASLNRSRPSIAAHALGIAKWRMVVNTAGAQLDFSTSAQCYLGGLFGTLFLPSIIGGDVVRMAVGLRRSPRPAAERWAKSGYLPPAPSSRPCRAGGRARFQCCRESRSKTRAGR